MSYFSGRIIPLAKATVTPLLSKTPMVSKATRDSAARRQLASSMARNTPRTFNQALLGFENVVITRRRDNSRSTQAPVPANPQSSQILSAITSMKTQKDSLIRQHLAEAKCETGKSTFTQALAGFENVTISRRGRSPKTADNTHEQTLQGFERRKKVSMVEEPKPRTRLELIAEEVTLLLAAFPPVRQPKRNGPGDVRGKFVVFRD
ncbi:hypothetical protein EV426DRAFT_578714 [Tirmania nivea]|nr:hypothetical protein EV426DRAFT_578714 [Tirmania nivea]